MKEHPILFSGPMVQAILENRKTMTRRVVKPQPDSNITGYCYKGAGAWLPHDEELYSDRKLIKCPYGRPGNRLWVRETWRVGAWAQDDRCIAVDYKADGFVRRE